MPDGLLFADMATKDRANRFAQDCKRYGLGLAVVESKRWRRPLDRRSGQHGEETAPSTQMLRYLRRIDDLTTGNLRQGFLTYGARWRLYFQGAGRSPSSSSRSISRQSSTSRVTPTFSSLSPHRIGATGSLFALVFRRDAFRPSSTVNWSGPFGPDSFRRPI